MSIDASLTDGTSLSSYASVTDQFGVRIGAQYRNYSTGQWGCYEFNLDSVAGKTVRHWYVVYDNRNVGTTGRFRGYFDSLKILWPGGKP